MTLVTTSDYCSVVVECNYTINGDWIAVLRSVLDYS
jgi:hypothetical protein